MSEVTPYYPCNDPAKPICRQFVTKGNCRYRMKCRFYHPLVITPVIKKRATRELGCCYCGSLLKRLINKRAYRVGEDGDPPLFFVVCGRTGRSIRNCM